MKRIPVGVSKLCRFLVIGMVSATGGCVRELPVGQAYGGGMPLLTGYWHNWNGTAAWMYLRDIPAEYDIVNLAFAVPGEDGSGRMVFTPDRRYAEAEFRADIEFLQRRGTRVLLSLGGGRHPIELQTEAQRNAFVESVLALCRRHRLNGIDLNLEGASIVLDAGDLDFRNPTTPKIRMMISAVKEIRARSPDGFMITAAPETRPVTGGFGTYGLDAGGWLPLLHHLRNELDLVHVQLYNSGTQFALVRGDRPEEVSIVTQGTPEFVWGVAEMLILGFPVHRDNPRPFPGLGAEKVSLGFPATPNAAPGGGYIPPRRLRAILQQFMTGRGGVRSNHALRHPGGHPRLGGVMTWSINWDAGTDGRTEPFEFSQMLKSK
jgi:chitinase